MTGRSLLPLWWLLVAAVGCEDIMGRDVVAPPPIAGVIALEMEDTGTADGASLTRVSVQTDTTLPLSLRAVSVTTTAGVFTRSGTASVSAIVPDSSGWVTLDLRAPRDTGTALVAAVAGSTGGPAVSRWITYGPALPHFVVVTTDSFWVDADFAQTVTVTAHLLRSTGYPSPRQEVLFRAYDTLPNPQPHGTFSNSLPSDSSGIVTVRFTPALTSADAGFHGPLVLTAMLARDTTIFGAARIAVR